MNKSTEKNENNIKKVIEYKNIKPYVIRFFKQNHFRICPKWFSPLLNRLKRGII